MKKCIKHILVAAAALFVVGLIIPERYQMPCGTTDSYNHQSFWWHPWTQMEIARVYAFEGELCESGADSGP